MEAIGFELQQEAIQNILTQEAMKTSKIVGEIFDDAAVRSSLSRHLGMEVGGLSPSNRIIDGIVEVVLDATENYSDPLTKERLCRWHSSLFPTGMSGLAKIETGAWRSPSKDPMQVISGPIGGEEIHFEAPPSEKIEAEIDRFLSWFNSDQSVDPLIKAGIAHFWFVTIHPFEDGNGRIGRAILEMGLARADDSATRYFSFSSQIEKERMSYYEALKRSQSGSIDISIFLTWYLNCLKQAIGSALNILSEVLFRSQFWGRFATEDLNERQILMLNRVLDGFEGKLTSSKWAKITRSSQDTAHRDITDLVDRGILTKSAAGGRSTSYLLAPLS